MFLRIFAISLGSLVFVSVSFGASVGTEFDGPQADIDSAYVETQMCEKQTYDSDDECIEAAVTTGDIMIDMVINSSSNRIECRANCSNYMSSEMQSACRSSCSSAQW